jgi:hypothetical protein
LLLLITLVVKLLLLKIGAEVPGGGGVGVTKKTLGTQVKGSASSMVGGQRQLNSWLTGEKAQVSEQFRTRHESNTRSAQFKVTKLLLIKIMQIYLLTFLL